MASLSGVSSGINLTVFQKSAASGGTSTPARSFEVVLRPSVSSTYRRDDAPNYLPLGNPEALSAAAVAPVDTGSSITPQELPMWELQPMQSQAQQSPAARPAGSASASARLSPAELMTVVARGRLAVPIYG